MKMRLHNHALSRWCAALAISATVVAAYAADVTVGDQAPNFKLEGTDGKTYDLADFKGKQTVVLAWYPKAYTSGCTIECKSLAEHGDLIKAYDVTYFMASVDPLDKNKEFAASEKADFPLLSDPTKKRRKPMACCCLSASRAAKRSSSALTEQFSLSIAK